MLSKQEIISIYEAEYLKIWKKYKIPKPYLRITCDKFSTVFGSMNYRGFKYSNYKPVLRINKASNNHITRNGIANTINHELLHLVNMCIFNYYKKPSHNSTFWKLCIEFGLPRSHYPQSNKLADSIYRKYYKP